MKDRAATDTSHAWTRYWDTAPKEFSGCLPGAPAVVTDFMAEIWIEFFTGLPQQTRLLDLGTGGGAVLLLAHSRRSDLFLTGVDYAHSLPDLGNSIIMIPQTNLTGLPFAEKSFDAITSQFALEYAPRTEAVNELKRVLTDDGQYLLFCHHAESVILEHNTTRLAAIQDILAGKGLINSALKIIRNRKLLDPKSRKRLGRLLQTLHTRHPEQPIVTEVSGDIARKMTDPDNLKQLLSLQQNLKMEGQRISALKSSALTRFQAESLAQQLSDTGGPAPQLEEICLPGTSTPLAWKISKISS